MGTLGGLILERNMPLGALLVVLYLIRKLYVYNRLRQFKGPWGVGFSDTPHNKNILSRKCYECQGRKDGIGEPGGERSRKPAVVWLE